MLSLNKGQYFCKLLVHRTTVIVMTEHHCSTEKKFSPQIRNESVYTLISALEDYDTAPVGDESSTCYEIKAGSARLANSHSNLQIFQAVTGFFRIATMVLFCGTSFFFGG